MDNFLLILLGVLALIGAVLSFTAKFIVTKTGYDKKQSMKNPDEYSDLDSLMFSKAVMKIKLIAAAIFFPAMLLLYFMLKKM